MSEGIGWAVIGTGAHVVDRMAPALARADDTRPAAVFSRDLSRAGAVAGQFGFARAYDSYQDLLKDDGVDAVYICTPNSLHAEQTIEAARAGKHVLVEKPMALSAEDAERMVEACDRAGVRLGLGFHLRHHPGHRQVRDLIRSGRLGDPVLYDARWIVASGRRGGWWQDPGMIGAYIFMARGVHLVDFVHFMSGRRVVEVTMLTDAEGAGRALEETAIASLRLDDNSLATLVAARSPYGVGNSFSIAGTAGYVQGAETIGPLAAGRVQVLVPGSSSQIDYNAKDPYQAEIEAFNLSIREGTVPDASGVDGLRVVEVTQALLESARNGRTVRLS